MKPESEAVSNCKTQGERSKRKYSMPEKTRSNCKKQKQLIISGFVCFLISKRLNTETVKHFTGRVSEGAIQHLINSAGY